MSHRNIGIGHSLLGFILVFQNSLAGDPIHGNVAVRSYRCASTLQMRDKLFPDGLVLDITDESGIRITPSGRVTSVWKKIGETDLNWSKSFEKCAPGMIFHCPFPPFEDTSEDYFGGEGHFDRRYYATYHIGHGVGDRGFSHLGGLLVGVKLDLISNGEAKMEYRPNMKIQLREYSRGPMILESSDLICNGQVADKAEYALEGSGR